MKIINKLGAVMEKKASLLSLTGAFLGFMACRVFIEHFLAVSAPAAPYEIIIEYIHDIYFFSISFILLWILISLITKNNPEKFSYLFLWGTLFVALPPVIDIIFTKGAVFWSFYVLGGTKEIIANFLTFFGRLPSGIAYFGTKIIFLFSVIGIGFFSFVKTKNYFKAFLGAIGTYLALFLMGAFPTFFFFAYSLLSDGRSLGEIRAYHIAQFFGSPQKIFGVPPQALKYAFVYNLDFIFFPLLIFLLAVIFFMISRKKFIAVAKNLRLPQIIYHTGVFLIGMGLGYLDFSQNFRPDIFSFSAAATLILCVWLSWIASVFINDIYDFRIDCISNPERPLPQKTFAIEEYAGLGIFCFLLAIIGSLSLGYIFAVLIFVYQFLAWIYSGRIFRLKKFPLLATFISTLALLMILFLGYILMSDGQTIHTLSWRIILLLLITYTISLPIKDFKDIEGDRSDGIWTIPVIFGEKKARLIVAISTFISYILSVFFLNELDLFFWALIFGIATFLVIVNEKIKPRKLPGTVLGLVSLYAVILVWIVFI